jgi:hypothetical protein
VTSPVVYRVLLALFVVVLALLAHALLTHRPAYALVYAVLLAVLTLLGKD